MHTSFRPPAVPLVTIDPYTSIWSMSDHLYDDTPRHWTTVKAPVYGLIRIDSNAYRFCGHTESAPFWFHMYEPSGIPQKRVNVTPTRSIYTFEDSGVELTLTFMTPLLLNDLELLSRPCSYLFFSLRSTDAKPHFVELYFDIAPDLCVDTPDQSVTWRSQEPGTPLEHGLCMGTDSQNILGKKGDNVRIDWGYVHVIPPHGAETCKTAFVDRRLARTTFCKDGILILDSAPDKGSRIPADRAPALSLFFDTKLTETKSSYENFFIIGYDDTASIEYNHTPLKSYCYRNGNTFIDIAAAARAEFQDIRNRCIEFDNSLASEAKVFGTEYQAMVSLAYRQAIAAHKLVADTDGTALFFSKECFSNGCTATVDVSYPSMPLFLLYQPELVKAMLRPVFRFAESDKWPYPFAPHDTGRYPRANGQVYGLKFGELSLSMQMPVEECGNILIMVASITMLEGNTDFAKEHWKLISKWAEYLIEKGFNPENQLCTDDFAGHLAHNVNLSAKAILGIAGYTILCRQMGLHTEHTRYMNTARTMADRWVKEALDSKGWFRLAFDQPGTWSLKYNLVWDRIFNFGLFPQEVFDKECAAYLLHKHRFGTPLDSRASFTKADWLVWAACLSSDSGTFKELIRPLYDFLHETPSRTPFCDWYGTKDGLEITFHNRSVVGGIFLPILMKRIRPEWLSE